ncbi:MAG: DUF2225 domain-containing protein [Gemmatimonadota bacterium]|jgi:uncharacterized protein (DUF2225 family)|nr:DUF2225 domain-containing protein [Gemmatimonadota bacterium]MDP6801868.1 DUF2225 domain-containing protein [Gemmatimonadota bacterium]MDP7031594.1 DUF2225 domain-containing protein [Gemmatimonadota bacterium]
MTMESAEIRICPVCEARFQSVTPLCTGSHAADSDFRPHFWGADPLGAQVQSCEECGFSGYAQDYLDGVEESVLRKIRKFLSPRVRDISLPDTAFYKYEFLALIYEWEDRSSLEVGDSFLRASWMARTVANREKERLYQREAVRRFEEALEIGECEDPETRAVVSYLVGDIHRRLNRRRRAEGWFLRAREEYDLLEERTRTSVEWLGDQIARQMESPCDMLD